MWRRRPPQRWRSRGDVDFALAYGSVFISAIDAGQPITVLAGVQVGCIEVFAKEGIHTIADLNGKRVGVQNLGSSAHVLLSIMCAQIGLDPAKDIHWISGQSVTPFELFVDGRIDAYLSSPPASLDMRARRIGHVILNTRWTHRGRNISAACWAPIVDTC
jgi:NitT/TauT family transport system substrate-binding protein